MLTSSGDKVICLSKSVGVSFPIEFETTWENCKKSIKIKNALNKNKKQTRPILRHNNRENRLHAPARIHPDGRHSAFTSSTLVSAGTYAHSSANGQTTPRIMFSHPKSVGPPTSKNVLPLYTSTFANIPNTLASQVVPKIPTLKFRRRTRHRRVTQVLPAAVKVGASPNYSFGPWNHFQIWWKHVCENMCCAQTNCQATARWRRLMVMSVVQHEPTIFEGTKTWKMCDLEDMIWLCMMYAVLTQSEKNCSVGELG